MAKSTNKSTITRSTIENSGEWLFRRRTALPVPIALVLLLLPATSPFSMPAFVTGLLVAAAGEALRLWGVHHIGVISRTRSDRLGPLIETGPFALVRNPLYLGNIALWAGFAVAARHYLLAPAIAAVLGAVYHAIVRWEERLLLTRIGEPYQDYMRRVPRWLPRRRTEMEHAAAGVHAAQTFSWLDTLHSERGTLIAVAAASVLLLAKERLLQR